jgi:hypothetical protein
MDNKPKFIEFGAAGAANSGLPDAEKKLRAKVNRLSPIHFIALILVK